MEFVFDESELFRYSDTELSQYINSLTGLPGYRNVKILSPKYIVKAYGHKCDVDNNIRAMEFASQLGVPVPQVHRVIEIPSGYYEGFYYIMDRIPGLTLEEAWPKLGWIKSIGLAFQLRYIIRRLRTQTSMTCGILGSGLCTSFFLNDKYGLPPNANADQVNAFLNFWVNLVTPVPEVQKTPEEHAICPRPVFTSSTRPFVYTHHDMAPRNLIVDPQGKLWVVDWESAGYYPEYFEYAGINNFFNKTWSKFAWWRWRLFAWIAGGFYDKERKWVQYVYGGVQTYRTARRFNILAEGYAAMHYWPVIPTRTIPPEYLKGYRFGSNLSCSEKEDVSSSSPV